MIILASASPRRKQLMNQVADSFSIYVSDIDESLSYSLPYYEAVKDIALRKGLKAKEVYPNDIIISADTIVVLDKEIIGKPKDEKDAKRILRMLSGKTHEVITSYTIIYKDKIVSKNVSSYVTFAIINEDLIEKYVKSGSPLDKAGAYGIQDNKNFHIVDKYTGSLNNIVGFPVEEIKEDIKEFID